MPRKGAVIEVGLCVLASCRIWRQRSFLSRYLRQSFGDRKEYRRTGTLPWSGYRSGYFVARLGDIRLWLLVFTWKVEIISNTRDKARSNKPRSVAVRCGLQLGALVIISRSQRMVRGWNRPVAWCAYGCTPHGSSGRNENRSCLR